jgi:hypothetical protein
VYFASSANRAAPTEGGSVLDRAAVPAVVASGPVQIPGAVLAPASAVAPAPAVEASAPAAAASPASTTK